MNSAMLLMSRCGCRFDDMSIWFVVLMVLVAGAGLAWGNRDIDFWNRK